MWGPTIGLSYSPDASKWDKVQGLLGRYPRAAALLRVIFPGEKFSEQALLFFRAESQAVCTVLARMPKLKPLIDMLTQGLSGTSYGGGSWPSKTIGLCFGKAGNVPKKTDFVGQCVCYALMGTATVANAGTLLFFYGIPTSHSFCDKPRMLGDPFYLDTVSKGVAVVSSAGWSANLPGLGAGLSLMWGDIS